MTDQEMQEKPTVQSTNNSISVDGVHIRGSVEGPMIFGNNNVVGYTVKQVNELIAKISTTFQPKPYNGISPYKGLDVFEEEDAELFFGREALVEELVSRVKISRTLFVTGPSGSGKSSLVRAGLLPALRKGSIHEFQSDRWLYATIIPGREPIQALARSVAGLVKSTNPEDEIRAKASTDETIFARWCEIALQEARNKRVVLFIDQFEEVFTQISREEERVAFLNLLTYAASSRNGRVILLFAMRSDFVPNCATYPRLNALLNQQFIQIGAMEPDELVRSIVLPAYHVGLLIDPALVAHIINDMQGEPGELPLMQFALQDLFDSQKAKAGTVTDLNLKDYLDRGGIHKALERHADSMFRQFQAEEQTLTRFIFGRLIKVDSNTQQDTKRTSFFKELVPANANTEEVKRVLQKLQTARLITTDENSNKYTITHEKLIAAWSWLKKLVEENRALIILKNEISEDTENWENHGHDPSDLYTGTKLARVREKFKHLSLDESSETFITASINAERTARQQKERARALILIGSISFSVIVFGLLLFSIRQLNISLAQNLGFKAQRAYLENNYNVAALYAYQSNLISNNEAANVVLDNLNYENFSVGKSFIGHTSLVQEVAWSADGRLASASWDHTIIIWDLEKRRPTQVLLNHTSVTSVAWSPDGRLASASDDGTIVLWDLATGKPAKNLAGHATWATSVAWSSDGWLASASLDQTVIVWDLDSGKPARILEGHEGSVLSVAWSPDGQLASGSRDETIIIWDLVNDKLVQRLTDQIGSINGVAWSSSGTLASGSSDGTVFVWDLTSEKPTHILKGHTDSIESIMWSINGQLASASKDKTVIIWNVVAERPFQVLHGHTEPVLSVAWSANETLASSSEDETAITWALDPNQSARILKEHAGSVNSIALSSDGRMASASSDQTVKIWDLNSAQLMQTLIGHSDQIASVAWSDDDRLASASNDGTVIVWDLQKSEPAHVLHGHTKPVSGIAWLEDGKLASTSVDATIIWDIARGEADQTLAGGISDIASSKDGGLAYRPSDGDVTIWKNNQLIQTLAGFITEIAWSPEGRLASNQVNIPNGDSIIIWNLESGQPNQILRGHTGWVTSIAWSEEGRLVSSDDSGTIIIWDLQNKRPAKILNPPVGAVNDVIWLDNERIAFASENGAVYLLRKDFLAADICDLLFRNMTIDEWRNFKPLSTYQPACPNLPYPTYKDPIYTGFPNTNPPFYEGAFKRVLAKYLYTSPGRFVTFLGLFILLLSPFIILFILARVLSRLLVPRAIR